MDSLVQRRPSLWSRSACGVTRRQREIPALLDRDAYTPSTRRARVLLVSGLSGRTSDVARAVAALDLFASSGQRFAADIALSAVPCGNPDGLVLAAGTGNGAGGDPGTGYPPEGNFFFDKSDPERRYLWRWIRFQAPDLVLEILSGDRVRWEANRAAVHLSPALGAVDMRNDASLLAALGRETPDGLGLIPGLRLTVSDERLGVELGRLLSFIPQFGSWQPSPARLTLDSRRSRSRLDVAQVLDSAYGRRLDPVNYMQGVGISGRLRLARLGPDLGLIASEIASLPDLAGLNMADPFGGLSDGSTLAGVVWGTELAEATGDRRWAGLLVQAADRYQPVDRGVAPAPAAPDFEAEDMFMSGALLGRAFHATGREEYLDLLARFLLDGGTQQDNGLFWHSRSAPYFWGRGNGFAALGLAETLSYLPQDHPAWEDIFNMYLKLMDALRGRQQPSGMFPQVLDLPGSYQEFTATCMFGYAAARGLRRGWLDLSFLEPVRLAWQGAAQRIDDEGRVVDACASTDAQANVMEYLDRPAVSGFDDRSGGMALWFAVELERLAQDDS